jgi:hypothetical protein
MTCDGPTARWYGTPQQLSRSGGDTIGSHLLLIALLLPVLLLNGVGLFGLCHAAALGFAAAMYSSQCY